MQYDVMIIGPATRDLNIDFDGTAVNEIGGAVTFCTASAVATGARVFSAVKISPEDRDILNHFPLAATDLALLPSKKTTLMRNEYFTATRERRNSRCLAQSDPILLEEIPDVDCKLYHLAGLLYGDFSIDLVKALAKRGKVSVDIQTFLRHNEGGTMHLHDWTEKKECLKYFSFFKTDAAEAEMITGLSDRREAAKVMHQWGAKEILISYNEEILVYDGEEFYTCPIKARNLSGRTGRGDTTSGCYLSMRMMGEDIPTALLYATACVSKKMEAPGVFKGTKADIEAYIEEFYR